MWILRRDKAWGLIMDVTATACTMGGSPSPASVSQMSDKGFGLDVLQGPF